jgi:hypothetical protein
MTETLQHFSEQFDPERVLSPFGASLVLEAAGLNGTRLESPEDVVRGYDSPDLVPFGTDIAEMHDMTSLDLAKQHTVSRQTHQTQLYDRTGKPSGVKTDEDGNQVDD